MQMNDKDRINNILKEINDYKAKLSSGEINFQIKKSVIV